VPVSDADLSTLYRGATAASARHRADGPGRLRPVLDEGGDRAQGQALRLDHPAVLPVDRHWRASAPHGETVALVNAGSEPVGTLEVRDIFPFDSRATSGRSNAHQRTDHPGGRMVLDDPRDMLLGGDDPRAAAAEASGVRKVHPVAARDAGAFHSAAGSAWSPSQTRNPLHRAHEYCPGGRVGTSHEAGHFAGAVLTRWWAETKGDDVDAATRMRTYQPSSKTRPRQGDKDEELWKKAGYDLTDQLILLGLDIKMFYAGPRRRSCTPFTAELRLHRHLIGRKHADAPSTTARISGTAWRRSASSTN